MNRYRDLQIAFGARNYEAALNHYLEHGRYERRDSEPVGQPFRLRTRFPAGPAGRKAGCGQDWPPHYRTVNDSRMPSEIFPESKLAAENETGAAV